MAKVSVVVPCLDAEPRLEACLASIAAQTYAPLEVIFVDNGSRDESLETARAFARGARFPVHVASCEERGHTRARSAGYAMASGAYVQWLDADDELTPRKIEDQVRALEREPDVDIVYGDWTWVFHEAGGLREVVRPGFEERDMLASLLVDEWRPPHAYLVRARAARALHAEEAWHPTAEISADREYFTTAALLGMRFRYAPGAMARYHKWSGAQVTARATRRARACALAAMFVRLNAIAARPEIAARLTDDHRALLERSWAVMRAASPREGAPLDALEARVLAALSGLEPETLDRARLVACTNDPALPGDPLVVARALASLVAKGALTSDASDASDASEPRFVLAHAELGRDATGAFWAGPSRLSALEFALYTEIAHEGRACSLEAWSRIASARRIDLRAHPREVTEALQRLVTAKLLVRSTAE